MLNFTSDSDLVLGGKLFLGLRSSAGQTLTLYFGFILFCFVFVFVLCNLYFPQKLHYFQYSSDL